MSQELSEQTQPGDEPKAAAECGWFLTVLPLAMVAACAELGIAVLNNSALPVYYKFGLGISIKLIPVIMIPFFVSEALFKLPLGLLSDRFGRRPLILLGALVTVVTPQILIHIRSNAGSVGLTVLLLLGMLRLFDGVGGAALWPAVYSYVGDYVEEKKRGAAMGLLNMVYMVALGISFLVGGFADDSFGPVFTGRSSFTGEVGVVTHRLRQAVGRRLRYALHAHHSIVLLPPQPPPLVPAEMTQPGHYFPSFYVASILFAVAALIAAAALKGRIQRVNDAGEPHNEPHNWSDFFDAMKSVPQFISLAFVTFMGIGCIAPLVKIFAIEEFKLSEHQVGIMTLWPALLIAAIAVPVGHLADHWGKVLSVRLGFFFCSVGLWGIPVLHAMHDTNQLGFVVSATVMGLGFVLAFPSWMALLTTLSSDHQRGTVLGAVSTGQGVGILIGYLIGPDLYVDIGHIAPFVSAASLVTAGFVLALIFVNERALSRSTPPPMPSPS